MAEAQDGELELPRIQLSNYAPVAGTSLDPDADLLTTTSHHLRSPLGIVILLAEILREENAGPLNEQQRGLISLICDSSQLMSQMLSDSGEYATLEARQIQLDPLPVDLTLLVEACVKSREPLALQKSIRLSFQQDTTSPALRIDQERIGRAVGLLLEDALLSSPAQSEVKVGVRCEHDQAVIEI